MLLIYDKACLRNILVDRPPSPSQNLRMAFQAAFCMETAHFVLDCFKVLSWPIVAILIGYWYRDIVRSLMPGAKITLAIMGLKAEATIPEIKDSVEESLGGEPLSTEQRKWLQDLFRERTKDIQDKDRAILRPLRDSGLIRTYPKKEQIAYAKGVEITTLGRLLVRQNLT